MKMIMKSVAVAGIVALAATTVFAKGGGQPVHTIRFTYKVAMTNTGVDTNAPDASGSATASESIQSNGKDTENLNVTLKGLQAGSAYSLFATTNGTSFDAADFNAGKNGDAKITLSTKPGKTGFPIDGLDPLTGVTELDVVDDSTNGPVTVLTADTAAPQTYTFMDKQTITSSTSTTGATGALTVSASNKSSKLSLTASGLTAGDSYVLGLNGTPTTDTSTANSKGDLKINTP